MKKYVVCLTLVLASLSTLPAQQENDNHRFKLSSTTFEDNTTLPLSMIYNFLYNGSNVCSADGSPGGNESPELSWRNAPRNTRSFAVMAFDVTAGFTHWGMYNIAPTATGLPQNAGVAGSTYGTQIKNDFPDFSYDGPCPPPGLAPVVHHYVFTVYALDKELELPPSSSNFPANGEALLFALTEAERHKHVLASASITGLYSTTPQ